MAGFLAEAGEVVVDFVADQAEEAIAGYISKGLKRVRPASMTNQEQEVEQVAGETAMDQDENESAVVASSPSEGLATDHDKLGRPLLSSSRTTTQLYQLRQLMWMVARPYMLSCGQLSRVTSQGVYKLNCSPGTGTTDQPVHIWELNTCQKGDPQTASHAVVHKLRHNGTWVRYDGTNEHWLMKIYDQFGYGAMTDPAPKMAMLQNLKINLNFRGRVNRPTKYTVMLVTDFSPHHQPDDPLGDGSDPDQNTWALWVKNTLGRLTFNPIVSHYQHKQQALPFRVLYHKNIYVKENTNGQDAMITYPMTIDYHVNKLYDFWHYDKNATIDTDHGETETIAQYVRTADAKAHRRPVHSQRMYMLIMSTDYMNTQGSDDAPSYDCMFYSKWLKPAVDV